MRASRPLGAVGLLVLATLPVYADPPIPSGPDLEAAGARIGRILITRHNIFDLSDPEENHAPYRIANKLHVVTREEVIRRELLFQEGQLYRHSLIEETERNLRSLRVIYNVKIRPSAYHNGIVDLEVTTQDTWTLRPSIRFGRSGGDNAVGFAISELNLLGRMKTLQLSRRSNVDRTTTELLYLDPRVFGSRYGLRLSYQDLSDGVSRSFSFARPFYSLDSRWSLQSAGSHLEQTSKHYEDGEVVAEFGQFTESLGFSYAVSPGLVGGQVARFGMGYSYLRNVFDQGPEDEGFGSFVVPPDQKFSGPVFTLELLQPRFITVTNYSQFGRDEDFNLGNQFDLSLQPSLREFGAERSELIWSISDTVGCPLGAEANLFYNVAVSGRSGEGAVANLLVSQSFDAYWRATNRQTLFTHLSFDAAKNLDPQNQLLLGGDTGLRGYPTRQFEGDRRLLLQVEHRYFGDWELFHLVRIGLAGFVDVGNAWDAVDGQRFSDLHPDFGVGIRFAVNRSSIASISRLDFAYAVDAEETDSPRFQVLFGTAFRF